jgi:meso-butanediol dehydrogenase / (S,S)-butanediol dehydrogenase / diacetyl reductase
MLRADPITSAGSGGAAMTRLAVVTGAGTGIGQATALAFAAAGFDVVANGRRVEKLEETRARAKGLSGQILAVAADVGTLAGAGAVLQYACNAGDFEVLVNNAGVGWSYGVERPGSMAVLGDTPPELWHEVLRINLDSVYFLCHGALPLFEARGGGSIVNVSSGGGLRGMADAHTYATAKAGIVNLTRSLARAYGPKNIRANVVAPGFVDTEMVTPVLKSDLNPFADPVARYQVSPLGRPGRPEEIASAIYYLAVDGTYCNGAVLSVDGGSLA